MTSTSKLQLVPFILSLFSIIISTLSHIKANGSTLNKYYIFVLIIEICLREYGNHYLE